MTKPRCSPTVEGMDTPEFWCGEAAEAVEKLIRYQTRNMDPPPRRHMCQQVRPHLLLAHSSTDVRTNSRASCHTDSAL